MRLKYRIPLTVVALALATAPGVALAHVGAGSVSSFSAGIDHPLSGLDHVAAMIAVGLWAALKGGRALWMWPCVFVAVMLAGGALGMAHIAVPFVEQGILASVVVLGLLVALAIDLPVWVGAAIIGAFAVLHGHAHGSEVAEGIGGVEYMAGFALATAALHGVGLAVGVVLSDLRMRPLVRAAGAACAILGVALISGMV